MAFARSCDAKTRCYTAEHYAQICVACCVTGPPGCPACRPRPSQFAVYRGSDLGRGGRGAQGRQDHRAYLYRRWGTKRPPSGVWQTQRRGALSRGTDCQGARQCADLSGAAVLTRWRPVEERRPVCVPRNQRNHRRNLRHGLAGPRAGRRDCRLPGHHPDRRPRRRAGCAEADRGHARCQVEGVRRPGVLLRRPVLQVP